LLGLAQDMAGDLEGRLQLAPEPLAIIQRADDVALQGSHAAGLPGGLIGRLGLAGGQTFPRGKQKDLRLPAKVDCVLIPHEVFHRPPLIGFQQVNLIHDHQDALPVIFERGQVFQITGGQHTGSQHHQHHPVAAMQKGIGAGAMLGKDRLQAGRIDQADRLEQLGRVEYGLDPVLTGDPLQTGAMAQDGDMVGGRHRPAGQDISAEQGVDDRGLSRAEGAD